MMKRISNTSINRRFMDWVAHMPINQRLLWASVIVAIAPGLVISVLGSVYVQVLNTHGQAVQVSTDAVKVATKQYADMQHMNADLIALQSKHFVASNTGGTQNTDISQLKQNLINEINTLKTSCKQTLTSYQQDYQLMTSSNMESVRRQFGSNQAFGSIGDDQRSTLEGKVNQEWHAYVVAQAQVLEAVKSNQSNTYQLLLTANEKYAPLDKDWNHVVALAETVSDGVARVDVTHRVYFSVFGIIAFLLILVVVVLIGYMVHLTIARPLRELVNMTRRISKGDTNARVDIKGSDEIYLVAESMNRMMDNIVQLIQEAQGQRDVLQEQIESLATEVRGIGQGNLQVQPEVVSGTLGAVAVFFNNMLEELNNLIIRVKMASHEVEASATVTLTMLAQLVQTSNVQLQEIAEATVEVGQMANSSRQVAERTHMLSGVVHDAQSAIEKGRLSVKRAINGMGHIHENVRETALKVQKLSTQSNNINDIGVVMSDIAQQMKSLANDAVTQASLVGENGKGFAVVASDIQRLAERTAGQINSIAQIVQGVREDITSATLSMQETERESSRGAELAREAGASLETSFAAVEHQAREMDAINRVTMQQLQSFNTINNIMHLIYQSTLQMNADTGNASQNLAYLARQIEELRNSVETFKLRQAPLTFRTTGNVDAVTPLPSRVSPRFAHFRSATLLSAANVGWVLPQGHHTPISNV
jgi:methyl-accepting chemotaxis protein